MKNKIKLVIILSIVLVLYIIFVSTFVSSRQKKETEQNNNPVEKPTEPVTPKKETNDLNIIMTPNTIISVKDDRWFENKDLDYENYTFNVYSDNLYKNMSLVYTNSWYIMEQDRNFIDYSLEKGFVAIDTKSDATFKFLDKIDVDLARLEIVYKYLQDRQIQYNPDTLVVDVYNDHFDNDGIKDDIYLVHNVFLDDYTGYNSTFAIGFVRLLNNNVVFYENFINNINAKNTCYPEIKGILSYNDDNIIIEDCTYMSSKGTKQLLFQLKDNEFYTLLDTSAN